MSEFKVGLTVRMKEDVLHEKYPEYYPAAGTVGFIEKCGTPGMTWWVQWPKGSTSKHDCWSASVDMLELIEEES